VTIRHILWPRRAHRCHLEVLAPCLAAAGWDVVLYGKIINTTHG
jgi:hypothetical protein